MSGIAPGDMTESGSDHQMVQCECGLLMKVAITRHRARVECPRCHERFEVPGYRELAKLGMDKTVEQPDMPGDEAFREWTQGNRPANIVRYRSKRNRRASRARRWVVICSALAIFFLVVIYVVNVIDWERGNVPMVDVGLAAAVVVALVAYVIGFSGR